MKGLVIYIKLFAILTIHFDLRGQSWPIGGQKLTVLNSDIHEINN